MNLVMMEQLGDCGPACLATVLGKTLEEVRSHFPSGIGTEGVSSEDITNYLCTRGVPALATTRWPSMRVPAIISAPSLNHPGLLHYIVWDGEEWLDPTHETLRYPDNAPVICGEHRVCWTEAIVMWLP